MVAGATAEQFVLKLIAGTETQLTLASVVVSKSVSLTNGVAVAVKAVVAGVLMPVQLLSVIVNA